MRCAHDALSAVRLSRPCHGRRSGADPGRRGGGGDGARRWHRPRAEPEAPAADPGRPGGAPSGGCAAPRRRRRHERAPRRRAHPRSAGLRCASFPVGRARSGRRIGRYAAHPQRRHAGRQPLPRYALQLLQPELRVAAGDRFLHEARRGGRRLAGKKRSAGVLGSALVAPLLGGVVDGHGARAGRSGGRNHAALDGGRAHAAARRALPRRRDRLPRQAARRAAHVGAAARSDRLAIDLLEAAPARGVRFSSARPRGGGEVRWRWHRRSGAARLRRGGLASRGGAGDRPPRWQAHRRGDRQRGRRGLEARQAA